MSTSVAFSGTYGRHIAVFFPPILSPSLLSLDFSLSFSLSPSPPPSSLPLLQPLLSISLFLSRSLYLSLALSLTHTRSFSMFSQILMIAILIHVKITARAKTILPCTLVTVYRATAAAIAKQVHIYTSHTYIHSQIVYQNFLQLFCSTLQK